MSTQRRLASFKCHLIFEAFFQNGFVSLDALVMLLAGLGPVGDVGSFHGGDLVRLGSFDRLRHARNNVKSNVNKTIMENEPL